MSVLRTNCTTSIDTYVHTFSMQLNVQLPTLISFAIQVSVELKASETNILALHIEETAHSTSESTYQSRVTWSAPGETEHKQEVDGTSLASSNQTHIVTTEGHRVRRGSDYEEDLDMCKEKRAQRYLITMVTLFATCWCPITILILVTHFVYEDDENKGSFDITYLTFTFFGYMSTCINPVLFSSWRMSDRTKNRLRGYFRFSNRRRGSAHSALSGVTEVSRLGNSPIVKSPAPADNTCVNSPQTYV